MCTNSSVQGCANYTSSQKWQCKGHSWHWPPHYLPHSRQSSGKQCWKKFIGRPLYLQPFSDSSGGLRTEKQSKMALKTLVGQSKSLWLSFDGFTCSKSWPKIWCLFFKLIIWLVYASEGCMQGEDSHVNSLYWACAELFFLRFSPRTIRMSPKRDTIFRQWMMPCIWSIT